MHEPSRKINVIDRLSRHLAKGTPKDAPKAYLTQVRKWCPSHSLRELKDYEPFYIMHAIGVPDQYILQRGGWISDNVMKTVYRNIIDLETAKQNKKINDHFKGI